jgi:hypothetical protein
MVQWVTLGEAASATNLSRRVIRWRRERGSWPARKLPDGSYLYRIDGGVEDEDTAPVIEPRAGPYAVVGDNYVFNLPSKPRTPWVVPKADVARLVAAYSRDGDNASLNQIARTIGWHRRTVLEVLRALGKTHDSAPFTDEDIAAGDEDALVEDLVRMKEEKVHVRAERESWTKTKDLADKARSWDAFIASLFAAAPKSIRSTAKPVKAPQKGNGELCAVSHATDLHYGKHGWVMETAEEYDRKECERRLLSTTSALIAKSTSHGKLSRAIIGVGGDWFHIDNPLMQTTRGTPQDTDGRFLQILWEGFELAVAHIEQWLAAVPVIDLAIVRGNHDSHATAVLRMLLWERYRNDARVRMKRTFLTREYFTFGESLIGFTHGEDTKDSELGALMATERREAWADTKYRHWFTGHWHTQKMDERYGVVVEHMPSLAGSDAWHHRKGYVGNRKALTATLFHREEGAIARILQGAK